MIIIIGGGLSGLVAAYRLEQQNIPYIILEANKRLGGRIYTKKTKHFNSIEMGATWFGNQHLYLNQLIKELDLETFQQYNSDYFYYYAPTEPYNGKQPLPAQAPSYRFSGGTSSILEALLKSINQKSIHFDSKVTQITVEPESIEVCTKNKERYIGEQVILSIPPKIWAEQINFSDPLPSPLLNTAKNTQSWMEDSIKAAVEFTDTFWKARTEISTIMSNIGPFTECYDHSYTDNSNRVLCGFLHPSLGKLNRTEREAMVIKQLLDIYGEQIEKFIAYHDYNWTENILVKGTDRSIKRPHQNNGAYLLREPLYNGKLILSGSESAESYPGYMEGAVRSAEAAVKHVKI